MPLTLAVDLGGTNMRVAVVDESGTIVDRDHAATPPDADTLDPFVDLLLAMRKKHDVEHGVVAVPGRVDNLAGTLLHAPNLPPKWFALIGRDSLQRALDLPVTLANDADAAAVGEAHFGAGRGHLDVVYLTISTGVGAGALVGGRLILPRYSAGEIGHTVIDRRAAAAGEPATVEDLGSGTAIGRAAAARGMASKGTEIGRLVRDGDPAARDLGRGDVRRRARRGRSPTWAPTILVVGGAVGRTTTCGRHLTAAASARRNVRGSARTASTVGPASGGRSLRPSGRVRRHPACPAIHAEDPGCRSVLAGGPGRRLDRLLGPDRHRPATGQLADSIEGQVRQALANVATLLAECGCGWEHVAKATLFVAVESPQWMTEVNAIYAEVLGSHRPARSTVGVAWLPMGAVFEIEVLAHRPHE